MTFRWSTRAGVFIWLTLAALLLVCAVRMFGHGVPVQTNLLALLPATERNPVAEEAVNVLARAAGDRAVFLIGVDDSSGGSAAEAAKAFAATLRSSGSFKHVVAEIPGFDLREMTAIYRQHRYMLLSDADRLSLANVSSLNDVTANLAERLQRKLYAPFQFGLSLPLAEDPFGLTGNWLSALPLRGLKLEPENGLLTLRADGKTWIFVSAELPGSAYDGKIARAGVDAVEHAERGLGARTPNVTVLRTGALFYADAARRNGEREVDIIGAGSLIGMLVLLYLMFRSVRPLLLGLFSVAFGIGAAMLGVVAVYGELHLITLAFGASLIGEAIDYSIQYFAAHLGAGKDWEPLAGLKRIAPGLAVALATSLLGYTALTFAPFPALKQIALFALIGLSAAWLTVFLLLPGFLRKANRRDPERAVAAPRRLLNAWQARMTRRRCLILIALLPVLCIPGWLQLKSDDDVRQLITRPPHLMAQESQLRGLIGFGNGSQFFLIEGADPETILTREEQLTARLAPLTTNGAISGYQALSAFVPSAARQRENHALWGKTVFAEPRSLKRLLEDAGIRDEVADAQLADYAASAGKFLTLEAWLKTPLSTPFRHLWLGKTTGGYASIVLPQGLDDPARLAHAADGIEGIAFVDKPGSVTQLFRAYRQWGTAWLLGALSLVFLVLLVRYPWRQAIFVLCPTVLAIAATLAVFGYLGIKLTLFNVMGMMLVLGIGVNYAIFLREGGVNAAATLAGVALSAGTTLLSFGLLAFSSMPALSGFGLTLLTGITIAVLLAPMSTVFSKAPA